MVNPHETEIERTARLLWQQDLIGRVVSRDGVLANPTPNNHVWILMPAQSDATAFEAQTKRLTGLMNNIDERLLEICETNTKHLALSISEDVRLALSAWRTGISSGANLDSVYHAERVIATLRASEVRDPEFENTLCSEARRFLDVPGRVKSLVRFNIYVNHKDAIQLLACLSQWLGDNSDLLCAIERIEIAKLLTVRVPPSYPTLIVYLNEHNRSQPIYSALTLLAAAIAEFTTPCESLMPSDVEFSDRWTPVVSVTQGFRLLKRYLRLFDLLEQVYEPTRNFAYLRENFTWFPEVLATSRHGCD